MTIKEFKQKLLAELEKYKCDFNWNFEKNKAKKKSYIALEDVIKIIGRI